MRRGISDKPARAEPARARGAAAVARACGRPRTVRRWRRLHGRVLLGGFPRMQRRRETTLEEFDELVLLRSDLDQDDVIVAGADIAIDRREVMLGRWPAADRLGHGLGRYMLARRREPFGVGQFRHDRPAGDRPTKIVVSSFARRLLPVGVAQRHFSVARAGAAGACVRLNEVGSRLGHDERIPLSSSEARGLGTAGGDRHRRLAVGPVEQAGVPGSW